MHTDVGGGYDRAFGDISDIALTWMIDLCQGSAQLDFREPADLLKEFQTPSAAGLDPSKPDRPPPVQKPWGLSKEHDEYHTATFVGAGWFTRTPGQYFIEMPETMVTNEYIHESVRFRMMNLEPKWEPPSLAGFKLCKDDEGYKWVKEVTSKSKGKQTVVLREWRAQDELSIALIGSEVQKELNDEIKEKMATQDVIFVKEKGYVATLGSAAGNAVTAPFRKIASFFS